MGLAISLLFSAIQLDWYPLAQCTTVFVGVYGLAKAAKLALLARLWWRRMITVFVIFGLARLASSNHRRRDSTWATCGASI